MLFSLGTSCWGSDRDFEFWTWESFLIDITRLGLPDNTKLYLENVNRFDRDASYLFQFHQRVGVRFDISWFEGWSIMPVWQHVDYEPGANEDRYHLDLLYAAERIFDTHWNINFRFRSDIRDLYDRDGISERFRPMISFSHPLPVAFRNRPLKIYVMNEVNYDTSVDKFNRHRFGLGFKVPLLKQASWTLGYQLETNRLRDDSWDSDSMLMVGIDFKF